MTATLTEARDEILTQFKTRWDQPGASQGIPVIYWDSDATAPKPPNPWARVTVQHSPVQPGQVTLAGFSGGRRFRRTGICTVQIFTPLGDGLSTADQLATIARSAFEGQTTPSSVIFRAVSVNEVGRDEGGWFQVNVLAQFEYDEIV